MPSLLRHRTASPSIALAAVTALGLGAPACGGDDEFVADGAVVIDVDAAAPIDAPADPDAAPDDAAGTDAAVGPTATAFITAGEFGSPGVVATLTLPQLVVTHDAVDGVAGSDPYLRQFGDRIYIVNRDSGENITIVQRDTLTLVDQFATGPGSNPQDVAVKGDLLYVAGLALDGVLVIDTTDRSTTTIDLSGLDSVDGHPDCVSLYLVGELLYAVCGQLDETFTARGPGKVAVIDTGDDSVIDSFELDAANPTGLLQPLGDDLLIATTPSYTDYSIGCLDRIATGGTPSASCLVANAQLAGYANRYQVGPGGTTLWINVSAFDDQFNSFGKLVGWDLEEGELLGAALSSSSQLIGDLAACPDGHLVVADNTFGAAGIRVYDADGEVTTIALDVGAVPKYGNNIVCW